MTIEPNDIIDIVAEYLLADGSKSQNTFTYRFVGDTSQTDANVMAAIATSLDNLYTDLAPYIYDGCVLNPYVFNIVEWQVAVQKWVTTRNVGTVAPTWTPTDTADQLPNQMAAVLTANTLTPLRKGRKFFGGFTDVTESAGELITAALTALAAAGVDYITALPLGGDNTLLPAVKASKASNVDGFVSVVANSVLGTQRRRKPGIGA